VPSDPTVKGYVGLFRCCRAIQLGHLFLQRRQENIEARSLPDMSLDLYASTMLGDDGMRHGEAETGTFADRLGREEGVEYAWQRGRIDAAAGVAYREQNARRPRVAGIGQR